MTTAEKSRRLLIIGMIGCLMYVIGDYLFAATGRGQTTERFGLMVRVAYLEMGTWRMVVSILCGFIGSLLYYMGFHRMYALLKARVGEGRHLKWVKLFRVAYITGTVAWTYVHAMFMTVALIFKYVWQTYGDVQTAANIANKVFYANAAPMLIAYILCDVGLTVVIIAMVWKRVIPLKSTLSRILATLCNPMMLPGVVGNLIALLPWPLNQIDHGTESAGHALVLLLGLILLKEMCRTDDLFLAGVGAVLCAGGEDIEAGRAVHDGEWGNTWRVRVNPKHTNEGLCFELVGCPLADFARVNGYTNLLPHMCASDHLLASLMHAKLIRTHTCATGSDSCDYWYVGDESETARAYANDKML